MFGDGAEGGEGGVLEGKGSVLREVWGTGRLMCCLKIVCEDAEGSVGSCDEGKFA